MITGRVQGVGYRAWTADTARRHGLTGWVRNRRDGSVEALFQGEDEAIGAMLADCRNGPPSALVTDVEVTDSTEPASTTFSVLPTA